MRKVFVLFAILFFLAGSFVIAQQQNARIVGKVVDANGKGLPGVSVTGTSPALVGEANTVSDVNGNYRLLGLYPGTYTIKFELEGFKTVIRKNIAVNIEETLTVNAEMEIGEIEEEIEVTADVPLIDIKSTTRGKTLTKEMFSKIPKGRNFDDILDTVPGVNNEPWLAGTSVDGASGAENMFYLDGMDTSSMYTGTNQTSAHFEMVEEVQFKSSGYQAEFGGSMGGVINVITRSGGNEFHGEIIGYYDGSMFTGKERDSLRLNPYDTTQAEYVNYQDMYGKDEVHNYEIGFNLGGYIFKDKLWFFTTVLPVFNDRTRSVDFLSDTTDQELDFTRNRKYYNGNIKLTAQPIDNLRLSGTFIMNTYKWRGDLPARDGSGNPDKAWADYGFDYPTYSGSGSLNYVIGNDFIFNARGGYHRWNKTNQLVGPTGPRYAFYEEITYSGTTNSIYPNIPASYIRPAFYTNYGYDDGFETEKNLQERLQFNADMTYYLQLGGEHSWKAGVQMTRIEVDKEDMYAHPYVLFGWGKTLSWPDGRKFKGKYGYYAVRGNADNGHPFGTVANPHSIRWSIYLQDSWTPTFLNNKVTLNIGVRAEKEDIPSFSDLPEYDYPPVQFGFGDKIAPRLGFVYDVNGDSSLKVFGSYGIFYDVMKLSMAEGSYGGFKWISEYYTLDTYKWDEIGKNNYFPGTYIGTQNWRIPSFDSTDPNLKPMSQSEYTLGIERKLSDNVSVSVKGVYKHLQYAIEDVGVQTMAGEMYYTANPGYGWTLPVSQGGKFADKYPATPRAKRDYYGITFSVDKRFSNNWMGGFAYTYSSLRGNYSGLASSDEYGRNDPNVERYYDGWFLNWDQNVNEIVGPLSTDKPHYIKAYGSYSFPFNLTVGATFNAHSGTPVSREFQSNHMQGYYPLGRASDGRTPFIWWMNAYAEYNIKLSKDFTLQLNANIDNLTDNDTATRVWSLLNLDDVWVPEDTRLQGWNYENTNYEPDPRFLKELAFMSAISARLGVKLIF